MKSVFKISFVVISFLFGGVGAQVCAQQSASSNLSDERIVKDMLASYDFGAAIDLIEEKIDELSEKKKDFSQWEDLLKKAELGHQMLSSVEQVCVIDSLLLPKSTLIQSVSLSPECGQFGQLKGILPESVVLPTSNAETAAYLNEMKDRLFYTIKDTAGVSKLCSSSLIIGGCTPAEPLSGLSQLDGEQHSPFLLSDGVTLYFSSNAKDGLGGFDLYVTRYSEEDKVYLKPQLMGMPFNSPANEYLYVLDEMKGIGCFATDRNQPADTVCLYFFLPNESGKTYVPEAYEDYELIDLAKLTSLKNTWQDKKIVENALAVLRTAISDDTSAATKLRIIISDQLVYSSLSQFRSDRARRIAEQLLNEKEKLEYTCKQLDAMRKEYALGGVQKDAKLADGIRKLEAEMGVLLQSVSKLEKNMVSAELQQ